MDPAPAPKWRQRAGNPAPPLRIQWRRAKHQLSEQAGTSQAGSRTARRARGALRSRTEAIAGCPGLLSAPCPHLRRPPRRRGGRQTLTTSEAASMLKFWSVPRPHSRIVPCSISASRNFSSFSPWRSSCSAPRSCPSLPGVWAGDSPSCAARPRISAGAFCSTTNSPPG